MINIYLNNKLISIDKDHSLDQILVQTNHHHAHFAIALNKIFIPRKNHSHTLLQEGDHIDVITPMQGG